MFPNEKETADVKAHMRQTGEKDKDLDKQCQNAPRSIGGYERTWRHDGNGYQNLEDDGNAADVDQPICNVQSVPGRNTEENDVLYELSLQHTAVPPLQT